MTLHGSGTGCCISECTPKPDTCFTAAVYHLQKDIQAFPTHTPLPLEYQLSNIGFKVSQLALANGKVGITDYPSCVEYQQ